MAHSFFSQSQLPSSPYINQFLSADTIVPDPTNPQDLNRFSYVRNNPLKYTDPSGHACVEGTSYCINSMTGQTSGNLSPWTGIGDASPLSQSQYCDRYPWACEDNDDEDGHYYQTENVICPAIFNCTQEEIQEYATMFQYPGQLPWNPVQPLGNYYVFPAPGLASYFGNPLLLLSGAINVNISDDRLTLTNRTAWTHIFHDGQVVRTYTESADGSWTVTTVGTGTNIWPGGTYIDQANNSVGAVAFNVVDAMMLTYITLDQLPGYLYEQGFH